MASLGILTYDGQGLSLECICCHFVGYRSSTFLCSDCQEEPRHPLCQFMVRLEQIDRYEGRRRRPALRNVFEAEAFVEIMQAAVSESDTDKIN